MTTLLLAAFLPVFKMLGYLVPFIGLAYGEAAQDDDDAKYHYIIPRDCGSEPYTAE